MFECVTPIHLETLFLLVAKILQNPVLKYVDVLYDATHTTKNFYTAGRFLPSLLVHVPIKDCPAVQTSKQILSSRRMEPPPTTSFGRDANVGDDSRFTPQPSTSHHFEKYTTWHYVS